jgi:hypothetical protein
VNAVVLFWVANTIVDREPNAELRRADISLLLMEAGSSPGVVGAHGCGLRAVRRPY